jgi:hypothetical protein
VDWTRSWSGCVDSTIGCRGKRAKELLSWLDLLEQEATRVAEEFCAADSRRQADHTRYLRDRARRDDK